MKHYARGSEIYHTEYERLNAQEKLNFQQIQTQEDSDSDRGRDTIFDAVVTDVFDASEDYSHNFDEDDHDFGGFGGGDGGGGGASDDF
jgi:hypothetical protein